MGASRGATRSFRVVVLAVAGPFALVALASILFSVRAYRNYDDETPTYDCGAPASFISGRARRSWTVADARPVPTTVPDSEVPSVAATPDLRMTDVCPKAMAPRLGFTVWVLALGLVATTVAALTPPPGHEWATR